MKKGIILIIIIVIVIVLVLVWQKSNETEITSEPLVQTQEQSPEQKKELAQAALTGKDADGAERVRSVRKLRIGSELEKCESETRKECMLVNGQPLDGDIEGFSYEEGFLYEINVEAIPIEEEDVARENLRLQYYFVEELSKMTPKEAEEKAAAEALADEELDLDPELEE